MSMPIMPDSSVKINPMPLNKHLSLPYNASFSVPHVAWLPDEARLPVAGLYDTFVSRPFLSVSSRYPTHRRKAVISCGKFPIFNRITPLAVIVILYVMNRVIVHMWGGAKRSLYD